MPIYLQIDRVPTWKGVKGHDPVRDHARDDYTHDMDEDAPTS